LTGEELTKLVEEYDKNKNGKLNLDEFVPFYGTILKALYEKNDK